MTSTLPARPYTTHSSTTTTQLLPAVQSQYPQEVLLLTRTAPQQPQPQPHSLLPTPPPSSSPTSVIAMAEDKPEDIAPPFHGFIATTYDALLVFEAARRGMIPRVTRRLNDSERNMVQSGSVFVYDEHESGIKRWTDGHSWSPSRILANFLVYRETIKPQEGKDGKDSDDVKKEGSSRPSSSHGRPSTAPSPSHSSLDVSFGGESSSRMGMESGSSRRMQPTMAHGQLRPRSAAEAGGCRLENGLVIDRHLERKLVGSLTNSYLFQPGGLVKKTMTLTISGFHQHVVSYYTLEDAVAGRLRRPSTIPEFASLEISPDYLNVANFRYPPSIDLGADGVPRYHGEPDDRPLSPARMMAAYPAEMYGDPYGQAAAFDPHHQPRMRSVTVPNMGPTFSSTVPSPGYAPPPPGSSGGYYESAALHSSSQPSWTPGPMRPATAGSRRYDPYSSANPRGLQSAPGDGGHSRRQSQPPPSSGEPGYYQPSNEYNYQPPSTAPGAFPYYSTSTASSSQPPMPSPMVSPGGYTSSQYPGWHQTPAMRLMPSGPNDPPSSSGSMEGGSSGTHMVPPSEGWAPVPSQPAQGGWDHSSQIPQPTYNVPPSSSDGWQAGIA